MPRWQVELAGHDYDLDDLRVMLTAKALRVEKDDDRYFLEAEQFETRLDQRAVYDVAVALLPRINGIAKLTHPNFKDVTLRGHIREVDGDETRQHAIVSLPTIEVRAHVFAPTILVDGKPATSGPRDSDERMRKASGSVEALRAVELWGGDHDSMIMWKAWELIREYSGLAIDPDQVGRLRTGLNDAAAAGDESRHEVTDSRHQPHAHPMTMGEAETFLANLLKTWLDSLRV